MDILSFALYHENNEVIDEAQTALNRKRQREEPITDSSDAEDGESAEKEPRRQAVAPEVPSVTESSMEIKRAIYEQVSKAPDGSVLIADLCLDIEDRESVMQALRSLDSDDGKVMMDEENVYLVD